MANPQKGEIILVDRTEVSTDQYGSFLKIYDPTGNTYRIPEKRSALWDTFRNALKNEPILTIFETYRNNDYIVDARLIKEEILQSAVRNQGLKLSDQQTEERNRSQAIAYAKDLCCSDKVEFKKLFSTAKDIYDFIKGLG